MKPFENPTTFRGLLELWPNRGEASRCMAKETATVRSWWRVDHIPPKHWEAVLRAAKTCGFRGITYATLARMTPGAALQKESDFGELNRRKQAGEETQAIGGAGVGSWSDDEG